MNLLQQDTAYAQAAETIARLRSRQAEVDAERSSVDAAIYEHRPAPKPDAVEQARMVLDRTGIALGLTERQTQLAREAAELAAAAENLEGHQRRIVGELSARHCREQLPAHLGRLRALLALLEEITRLNAADLSALRDIEAAGFDLKGISPAQYRPREIEHEIREIRREIFDVETRLLPEDTAETMSIRLLRTVNLDGKEHPPLTVLKLGARVARGLISDSAAERVDHQTPRLAVTARRAAA